MAITNGNTSDRERLLTTVVQMERRERMRPSTSDLMERLRLSRPTVDGLVERERWLVTEAQASERPGRPVNRISVRRDGYILAMAMGHATIRVGLARLLDEGGQTWIDGKEPTEPDGWDKGAKGDNGAAGEKGDKGAVGAKGNNGDKGGGEEHDGLARLKIATRHATDKVLAGVDPASIAGVGVVVPAPLDRRNHVAYGGPGEAPVWPGIRISDYVAAHLPQLDCDVVVINDANAGLLAEHSVAVARRGGLGDLRDALYVKWSTGIGGALSINGRLYEGAAGYAGELGHIVVPEPPQTAAADDDVPCRRCGNRCLESVASGEAICRRLAKPDLLGVRAPRTTQELVALSKPADDPGAETVRGQIEHAAEMLGRALGSVVTVLNPAAVAVGGRLPTVGADVWLTPLQRGFADWVMPAAASSVTFVPGRFEENSASRGAVEAVRERSLVKWLLRRPTREPSRR